MRFFTPYVCKLSLLALLMVCYTAAQSQSENEIIQFINSGQQDATKLMQAYLDPVVEGASYGFTGGWFNTAKTHKTLGFDLGVSANAVFIPSSKNYFDPSTLGLTTLDNFQNTTSPNGQAPTIAGPDDRTEYTVSNPQNPNERLTFNGPRGLDFKKNLKISGVVTPMIQAGIGIYKNTDLKLRFVPETSVGDSKIKMFGIGVMHDVKQHIPGIRLLPFDLSVLVGYTKISGSTGLSDPDIKGSNQDMNIKLNSWLFQALISKKVAIVTFYGGVGYATIKTHTDVVGSYQVTYDNGAGSTVTYNDPVALQFKNSSLRLTGGFRLNLGPIYLNTDYTVQQYGTLSVGVGATVR